jgi:membrane fusion protein (multidrug efflux system)
MKIKHIVYALLTIIIDYYYRITENKSANNDSKDPKEKEKSINVTGIVATPQTFDNNCHFRQLIEE